MADNALQPTEKFKKRKLPLITADEDDPKTGMISRILAVPPQIIGAATGLPIGEDTKFRRGLDTAVAATPFIGHMAKSIRAVESLLPSLELIENWHHAARASDLMRESGSEIPETDLEKAGYNLSKLRKNPLTALSNLGPSWLRD